MAKQTKKNQSTKKSVKKESKVVEKVNKLEEEVSQENQVASTEGDIEAVNKALESLSEGVSGTSEESNEGKVLEEVENASKAPTEDVKEEPVAEDTVNGEQEEKPSSEESSAEKATTVKEESTEVLEKPTLLLGFDVSKVGTKYPATGNRHVVVIRQMIRKLEYLMVRMSDKNLESVAMNLQAGLNMLEERANKVRSKRG